MGYYAYEGFPHIYEVALVLKNLPADAGDIEMQGYEVTH